MSKKARVQSRTERAAEVKAAQARRERRRRWLTVGAVAAVILVIVGGSVGYSMWQKEREQDRLESAVAAAGESEHGLQYGDPDAPHDVVIYADFLCSHCASLERAAGEDLSAAAEDGQVLIDYRPVAFLGEDSVRMVNAFKAVLEEAGPQGAKEFYDALFTRYTQQPLSDEQLVELAVEAGAEEDAVRAAITELQYADWVEEATVAAQEENVTGTPTVLLDGSQFSDGGSAAEIGQNLVAAVQ